MLWLVSGAIGCVAAIALVLLYVPFSLSSNLQGRAEPSGSWAVALGFGLGPVALSAIAAAGVPPFLTCHLFRWQVLRVPLSRWLHRGSPPAESHKTSDAPVTPSRFERALTKLVRDLDPVEVLLTWWDNDTVFEVRSLQVDVAYSFCDIALTGQILAAFYMLSGVLPERYVINQSPSWEAEDRLQFAADGRFRIWPGRLVFYLARFMLNSC